MIHERPIPGGGEPEKEIVGAVAEVAVVSEAGARESVASEAGGGEAARGGEAAGGETPGGGGRRGRDGRRGGRDIRRLLQGAEVIKGSDLSPYQAAEESGIEVTRSGRKWHDDSCEQVPLAICGQR